MYNGEEEILGSYRDKKKLVNAVLKEKNGCGSIELDDGTKERIWGS